MQPPQNDRIKASLEQVREERGLANLAQQIHQKSQKASAFCFQYSGDKQKSSAAVKNRYRSVRSGIFGRTTGGVSGGMHLREIWNVASQLIKVSLPATPITKLGRPIFIKSRWLSLLLPRT
jgi:hypothetical protein